MGNAFTLLHNLATPVEASNETFSLVDKFWDSRDSKHSIPTEDIKPTLDFTLLRPLQLRILNASRQQFIPLTAYVLGTLEPLRLSQKLRSMTLRMMSSTPPSSEKR